MVRIPIVLLTLPLVLWKIRSRPPDAAANAGKAAKAALPGAELRETVRPGRSVLDSQSAERTAPIFLEHGFDGKF